MFCALLESGQFWNRPARFKNSNNARQYWNSNNAQRDSRIVRAQYRNLDKVG